MRLANIVKVQKPIVISDTRHLARVIVFLRFTVYAAAFSNPTQIKCVVYATGHCILIRPASVIVTHFHHLITRSRITFYWYKKRPNTPTVRIVHTVTVLVNQLFIIKHEMIGDKRFRNPVMFYFFYTQRTFLSVRICTRPNR